MSSLQPCQLLYVDEAQQAQIEQLQALIIQHRLSLNLTTKLIAGKLNKKQRQQLIIDSTQPILLLDNKNKLSWLSGEMNIAPEWDKLQRRIVSAGRKTELLLQATKITENSMIVDATAGFGHDSLILASTGAQVLMLEQQPLMALLLLAEQQRMSREPNWQKLMARLHIINTDALRYFAQLQDKKTDNSISNTANDNKIPNVIYLDPMFPEDSYQDRKTGKGAKVGKQMQALHHLARPPTLLEEQQLLQQAQNLLKSNTQQSARVVIKRPQQAPLFAEQPPDETWHNEAIRFDGYFV